MLNVYYLLSDVFLGLINQENMKIFLLVLTAYGLSIKISHTLELPINIILHLDKRNPNYLEKLLPWNSYTVPLEANLKTLNYVIGVFRHGNKPPTDTYDGDSYPYNDEKYWPNGHSQLTKVGKQQMYSLGKTLRKRYNGYLSRAYKSVEILVKGNPLDRIFMSAACLLAGLYPPIGGDNADKLNDLVQLEWQPVPIWEQFHDMSQVVKNPTVCPRFYKLGLEIEDAINKYTYQYQELLDYLNNCTGLGVKQLRNIYLYWNIIYFQEQEGFERPHWINGLMEELTNLASSTFTAQLSSNQEMKRLIAGPLIKEFSREFREKTTSRDRMMLHRKLHLEGGHGTTLNGLLPALGFKEPFVPQLGSIFLMELHTSAIGNYIQAFYISNSTTEEIELLEIPDCGYECPLNQMLERMDAVTPLNWKAECDISGQSTEHLSLFSKVYSLGILIWSGAVIILNKY